jgi:magnesium transporter
MHQRYAQEHKMFVATNSATPLFEIFECPSEEERDHLINNCKIDPHALNAALNPESLARVEIHFSHVAIILKVPQSQSEKLPLSFRTTSVGYFLYENKLIVVIPEKLEIIGHERLNRQCTPSTVLLHSLEAILEHFGAALSNINRKYDELETRVNASTDNRYLLNLFTMEKGLVYFLSAMNTNTFVIEKLRDIVPKFGSSEEDIAHLESVAIENRQCYQQAEIYSNILSGLSSARVSIVSNNLSVLMKTLNLITIGIMVPTFVVSVFSMNVEIPLQKEQHAFTIVLLFAIFSVLLFIAFFWKFATFRTHK